MSTISEKLERLAGYKSDIKSAIIDKGQVVDDDMSTYASAIEDISGGGGDDTFKKLFKDELTTFNVPSDITEMPPYACYEKNNLQTVDLNNVTKIGEFAFAYCANLSSISIPNVSSFGDQCFVYTNFGDEFVIPHDVEYVGYNAFDVVSSKITFKGNVKMDHRSELMYRPDNIREVEFEKDCNPISSIYNYDNDGNYPFYSLIFSNPTIIPAPADSNVSLFGYRFSDIRDWTSIYVPDDQVDAWKADSYWSNYADHIFGLSEKKLPVEIVSMTAEWNQTDDTVRVDCYFNNGRGDREVWESIAMKNLDNYNSGKEQTRLYNAVRSYATESDVDIENGHAYAVWSRNDWSSAAWSSYKTWAFYAAGSDEVLCTISTYAGTPRVLNVDSDFDADSNQVTLKGSYAGAVSDVNELYNASWVMRDLPKQDYVLRITAADLLSSSVSDQVYEFVFDYDVWCDAFGDCVGYTSSFADHSIGHCYNPLSNKPRITSVANAMIDEVDRKVKFDVYYTGDAEGDIHFVTDWLSFEGRTDSTIGGRSGWYGHGTFVDDHVHCEQDYVDFVQSPGVYKNYNILNEYDYTLYTTMVNSLFVDISNLVLTDDSDNDVVTLTGNYVGDVDLDGIEKILYRTDSAGGQKALNQLTKRSDSTISDGSFELKYDRDYWWEDVGAGYASVHISYVYKSSIASNIVMNPYYTSPIHVALDETTRKITIDCPAHGNTDVSFVISTGSLWCDANWITDCDYESASITDDVCHLTYDYDTWIASRHGYHPQYRIHNDYGDENTLVNTLYE